LIAAALLTWLVPNAASDPVKLGTPVLGPGVSGGAGLVIELILTFLLVWVIFATAADPRRTFRSIAGLAIGFTISLDIFMGGPFTRAERLWSDGWLYYLGPALGAVLAGLAYEWLYLRPLGPEPVGPAETGVEEPAPGRAATE
jgi:aquaporin TIP